MRELDQEYLMQCFDYSIDTGLLVWKERPIEHFKDLRAQASWNSTNAGRPTAQSQTTHGYLRVSINKQRYFAHRVVFALINGFWPKQVDHANGIKTDNRICNLRACSQSENMMNRRARAKGTRSGVKGVNWCMHSKKWNARIYVNGRSTSFGYFSSVEEAAQAVSCARKQYHKDFANNG